MNQPHPSNDWYRELCALAAIGEASPSEFEELQQHLDECDDCRALYADFRRIASDDLGMVAALRQTEQLEQAGDAFDENEVFSRLLARVNDRQENRSSNSEIRRSAQAGMVCAGRGSAPAKERTIKYKIIDSGYRVLAWLGRPALSYGWLAVILCIAAALGAYRLRERQFLSSLQRLSAQLEAWKGQLQTTQAQEKNISESLRRAQLQRDILQQSLNDAEAKTLAAQTEYDRLRGEKESLESQLAALRSELDQRAQELHAANGTIEDKSKRIAELENREQLAADRMQEQRENLENLQSRLQSAQHQIAELESRTPEAQGFTDADAKQLFGARDLHIVDVYDVAANGKTKRTYGRVYYVEKKLLIFYAFDLEDKKRNREAAGFQAWGYREASESKPENLGLFRLDDSATNRWVLQVNNPRVLQHVDAVFVTLEPADGSLQPRGRKLLYANLLSPPNHP